MKKIPTIKQYKNAVVSKLHNRRLIISRAHQMTEQTGVESFSLLFIRLINKEQIKDLKNSDSVTYKTRKHSEHAIMITNLTLTREALNVIAFSTTKIDNLE